MPNGKKSPAPTQWGQGYRYLDEIAETGNISPSVFSAGRAAAKARQPQPALSPSIRRADREVKRRMRFKQY